MFGAESLICGTGLCEQLGGIVTKVILNSWFFYTATLNLFLTLILFSWRLHDYFFSKKLDFGNVSVPRKAGRNSARAMRETKARSGKQSKKV
jgi:hypothetical protein